MRAASSPSCGWTQRIPASARLESLEESGRRATSSAVAQTDSISTACGRRASVRKRLLEARGGNVAACLVRDERDALATGNGQAGLNGIAGARQEIRTSLSEGHD